MQRSSSRGIHLNATESLLSFVSIQSSQHDRNEILMSTFSICDHDDEYIIVLLEQEHNICTTEVCYSVIVVLDASHRVWRRPKSFSSLRDTPPFLSSFQVISRVGYVNHLLGGGFVQTEILQLETGKQYLRARQ
jgi:hypothetical protein